MYLLLPYVGLFEKVYVYQCGLGILYDRHLIPDRASAVNLTSLKDCKSIVCGLHVMCILQAIPALVMS